MPTISPKTTPYYGGGQVLNPANVKRTTGAPPSTLTEDKLGTIAVDNAAAVAYMLASKSGGVDTWVSVGGGTTAVGTLTGNTGTATPVAGNILISGTGTISTTASGSTVVVTNTGPFAVSTLTGIPLAAGTGAVTALTYTTPTSWTPNVQINGSSTGITYTTQTGYYTQIGNLVEYGFRIILSSKGASTGTVTISNMPVSTGVNGSNFQAQITFAVVTFAATNSAIVMQLGTTSTVGTFFQYGGAETTLAALTNSQIANTTLLQATGTYLIV